MHGLVSSETAQVNNMVHKFMLVKSSEREKYVFQLKNEHNKRLGFLDLVT